MKSFRRAGVCSSFVEEDVCFVLANDLHRTAKKHLGDGPVLHRHVLHFMIVDLWILGEHVDLHGGGEVVALIMLDMRAIRCLHDVRECPGDIFICIVADGLQS